MTNYSLLRHILFSSAIEIREGVRSLLVHRFSEHNTNHIHGKVFFLTIVAPSVQAVVTSAKQTLYIFRLKELTLLSSPQRVPRFAVPRDADPFLQFTRRFGNSPEIFNLIVLA